MIVTASQSRLDIFLMMRPELMMSHIHIQKYHYTRLSFVLGTRYLWGLHGHFGGAYIRMAYHVILFTHTNRKLFLVVYDDWMTDWWSTADRVHTHIQPEMTQDDAPCERWVQTPIFTVNKSNAVVGEILASHPYPIGTSKKPKNVLSWWENHTCAIANH